VSGEPGPGQTRLDLKREEEAMLKRFIEIITLKKLWNRRQEKMGRRRR